MSSRDFDKYKNRLFDYFRMNNIDFKENGQLTKCPFHEDSTPSFNVTDKGGVQLFKCFGCGAQGTIYDAVKYVTGETDIKRQYDEVDRIFGTGEAAPLPPVVRPQKKEEPVFSPKKEDLVKFENWLKNQTTSELILSYFNQRAKFKSNGLLEHYPDEISAGLVTHFFWYPGNEKAEKELGKAALFAAGVAYSNKDMEIYSAGSQKDFPLPGKSSIIYLALDTDSCYRWNNDSYSYEPFPFDPRRVAWKHSGIVAKSPEGFKLLFMNEKTYQSEKRNPRSGVSFFPIPSDFVQEQPAILMEGEIDAIVCRCAGISNAYSFGGLGNFSVPKIKQYIIPKNIPEIVLFADNDKAPDFRSQKIFGLIPFEEDDKFKQETLPQKLIRAGFTGRIKLTVLPSDCGFKDPDDAIRNGNVKIVKQAIADAKDYTPLESPVSDDKSLEGTIYKNWDYISLKFLRSILKKLPVSVLDEDEIPEFVTAAAKSCKDTEALDEISAWSNSKFNVNEIKKLVKREKFTPFDLVKLLERHEISDYFITKLNEQLVPAKEILRLFKMKDTIISINYDKAITSKQLQTFLNKRGNYSAAEFLADITDGNIIYYLEEAANYAFDGLKWRLVPDFAVTAHDILQNVLIKYLEKNLDQKEFINKVLTSIESRRFRSELVRDFNGLEKTVWGKSVGKEIMFDSLPIRATLTLADGVMDFSGEKIQFRKAKKEEYRRSSLPYTIAQVKKAGKPVNFIKMMQSNFKVADSETLKKNPVTTVESLMYYLSLIQSRDTSRRYGGFFLGIGGTGKTTLLKILVALYPNCTTALNENLLVSATKHFDNPNGPTPELAKLECKLMGYISETPEHGKLNETIFKRLTGGDIMTARTLHHEPHDFYQSAQIVIASNNSPSFSYSETAAIDRMIIFRFNVKHEKGLKDSKTPEQLIETLRPEFPAMIKYFAQFYIDLNINKKGRIPLSTECMNEKGLYISQQANDTDKFIDLCLEFDMNKDKAFIPSKDLYSCYLLMLKAFYNKEFVPGTKECPTQRQFTTWLKNRVEFQNTWDQQRVSGSEMPEWGFKHLVYSKYAKELIGSSTPAQQQELVQPAPPEDDPFAGYTPMPSKAEVKDSLQKELNEDDDDSRDMDIF